jgi:hypothetical protein
MVNVPDIQIESLIPRKCVSTIYLRPAGQAGQDFVTAKLVRGIPVPIIRVKRPGADQAHLAAQNIY